MAPFHVLKKNYLQNFNVNYKGPLKACPWAHQKPECSPIFDMKIALFEDLPKLLDFARKHFYRDEPLRVGSKLAVPEKADEMFHMEKIGLGTCIMAVKPDFNESIVGAIIAGPKTRYQLAHLANQYNERSKWGRILKIWAQAEEQANAFNRLEVSRILHAYMLAVHKDYRGYGLGMRLLRELATVGKKDRYEAISIDATSAHAACACQDFNMRLMSTIAYEDYMDDKGYLVFETPCPHYSLNTYAKVIRKLNGEFI